MNLDEILRQSLNIIKSKWTLPTSGFLSGGALSNIAWEVVSGNPAVINDLDIYILDKIVEKPNYEEDFKEKQNFKEKEKVVYEDYTGLSYGYETKNYYVINQVSTEGIYNYITYNSNSTNPEVIINSFDINCCQVGYQIEEDKFYWTKDFESFLRTGEIRLANLTSPSHSAIRLAKKKIDLNAQLPELELDIISYALEYHNFLDTAKHRFKHRYAKMFEKYKDQLWSRFRMIRDLNVENFLQSKYGKDENIWRLKSIKHDYSFNVDSRLSFQLSKDFLFWIRNIYNHPYFEKMFYRLRHIFDINLGVEGYLDCEISDDDLELLERLVEYAPNCVDKIKGMSLSKQLNLVKTVLDKFKDDPIIGISILEKTKIDETLDFDDDMTLLILELSVRKMILEDPRDKVRKILQKEIPVTTKEMYYDNLPF